MKEVGDLKFDKAIKLVGDVNLDIHTIYTADACYKIVRAAIYATFLRRNESYSYQLILSRYKIIRDGMSQPTVMDSLKQSLVFIYNSAPREKFDFYFPAAFWWY